MWYCYISIQWLPESKFHFALTITFWVINHPLNSSHLSSQFFEPDILTCLSWEILVVSLTSWGCSWLMAQLMENPLSRSRSFQHPLLRWLLEDLMSSLAFIQRHPISSPCQFLHRAACSTAASFHQKDQWWTRCSLRSSSTPWPYHVPYCLSIASLIKQWKYLLKIQLWHLLDDSTQWSWNSMSSRPVFSRQNYLVLMCEWGIEEWLTSVTPNDLLTKLLLPTLLVGTPGSSSLKSGSTRRNISLLL